VIWPEQLSVAVGALGIVAEQLPVMVGSELTSGTGGVMSLTITVWV
jgi:hypothetical protein